MKELEILLHYQACAYGIHQFEDAGDEENKACYVSAESFQT